jgi:hypothetical protein
MAMPPNEEYDPATDRARERAPLPQPLSHIGVVGLNGKIYPRCDSYMSGEILLGDADIHCTPGLVFHRRDKKLLVESAHRVM